MNRIYLPVVIRKTCAAAVDALQALDVPLDEAMTRVEASWHGDAEVLLQRAEGGRWVAAVRVEDGVWLACNAFPEYASARRADAERGLAKVARRGRRGCVVACAESQLGSAEKL